MSLFRQIYQYRELLLTNVKKDIRGKYKGSVLGVIWSFSQSTSAGICLLSGFPYLLGNVIPNYLIYLITGLIP